MISQYGKKQIRWMLVLYDLIWYLAVALLILVIYPSYMDQLNPQKITSPFPFFRRSATGFPSAVIRTSSPFSGHTE